MFTKIIPTPFSGDRLPTLSSERLRLRWLEPSDAASLFAIFSDVGTMRYWSWPAWTEPAAAAEFVDDVHKCFADGSLYQWGVVRADGGDEAAGSDAVIGTCTLAHIDWQNRRAEIGFILRRDLWGRGLMLEATRTLLAFAFDTLNLHRVEADVDPRNAPSIRLLQRLGFQREGYLRERWIVGEEINDTVMYGLLGREWLDQPRTAQSEPRR